MRTQSRITSTNTDFKGSIDVACIGMLTPAEVYVVDQMPDWNTGSLWKARADFISDDAAIVACVIKKWGLSSGLVCNKLGNDISGQNVIDELESLGVIGQFIKDENLTTPHEIVISDSHGGRTYIWDRREDLLSTMEVADISVIEVAKCAYADWYDYPHNLTAIKEAVHQKIPILINIEDQYQNFESIKELVRLATWVQCTPDQTNNSHRREETCRRLLKEGVEGIIFTGSEEGCMWATNSESFAVKAPSIDLVDANGAGAVLSSGFLYGYSKGWDFEASCRFAVSAASLQCQEISPSALPVERIIEVSQGLETVRF
jgi:sugar/nucleoside kinase (ribokinase family)